MIIKNSNLKMSMTRVEETKIRKIDEKVDSTQQTKFSKIQQSIRKGKYKKALKLLDMLGKETKHLTEYDRQLILLLKGTIYIKMGDHATGLKLIDQVLDHSGSIHVDYQFHPSSDPFLADLQIEALITKIEGLLRYEQYDEVKKLTDLVEKMLVFVPQASRFIMTARLQILKVFTMYHFGDVNSAKTILNELIETLDQSKDVAIAPIIAMAKHARGNVLLDKGHLDQALRDFEESLIVRKKIGNQQDIADSLHKIGIVHRQKGNLDEALRYLEEGLNLRRKIGNEIDISSSLTTIGLIYWQKGFLDEALNYFEQSLNMERKLGTTHKMAITLINMGNIYYDKGELDRALEYYEQSLTLFQNNKTPLHVAFALNNIGTVYRHKGELDRALEYLEESLTIFREIGNANYISETLLQLGVVHREKVNLRQAITFLEESAKIREEIGNQVLLSETLLHLILTTIDFPAWHDKIPIYLSKLEACHKQNPDNLVIELRFKICQAIVYLNMARGILSTKKGHRKRDSRMRAELLFEEIIAKQPIVSHEVMVLASLALCQHLVEESIRTNDPEVIPRTREVLDKLLNVAKQQNSQALIAQIYWIMAKISLLEGHSRLARDLMTRAEMTAEEWGLNRLAAVIARDHDELLSMLEQSLDDEGDEVTLPQKIVLSDLKDLISRVFRGQVFEKSTNVESEDEIPVFLMIVAESGILLYSKEFTSAWQGTTDLVSGFLSAFQSFGQELFSRTLDRLMLEEYTIVFVAESPIIIAYACMGSSYEARQRLFRFRDALLAQKSMWTELVRSARIGKKVPPTLGGFLDMLAAEVIPPDSKQVGNNGE